MATESERASTAAQFLGGWMPVYLPKGRGSFQVMLRAMPLADFKAGLNAVREAGSTVDSFAAFFVTLIEDWREVSDGGAPVPFSSEALEATFLCDPHVQKALCKALERRIISETNLARSHRKPITP